MKLLNVVDEYTREALQMLVERRIDADSTVGVLERLVILGGAPELVRCDNGPELTAHALRDWCRLGHTGAAFIDPGAPWHNAYVESFHARVRDELLDIELFSCLDQAQVVIEDWRQDYNANRPHSSLGMRSPQAFAAALTSTATRDETNGSWGRETERPGNAIVTITTTALVMPTAITAGSG